MDREKEVEEDLCWTVKVFAGVKSETFYSTLILVFSRVNSILDLSFPPLPDTAMKNVHVNIFNY